MPGILREDKEETVMEEPNRKFKAEELVEEVAAKASTAKGGTDDVETASIKITNGQGNGEGHMANGRSTRDASTDSEPQMSSSSSEAEADRSTTSETNSEPVVVGVASGKADETSESEGGAGSSSAKIFGKLGGENDGKVYNIKLCLPGVQQPVNIILVARDTVQDLLQYALDRPECCYRTALSARCKGKRLDDFVEIGSVEGLAEESTIEIVEELYTQRDARLHVQRLKDLLSTNPVRQSLIGADGFSLTFLSSIAAMNGESWWKQVQPELEVPGHILPQESEDPGEVPLESFYPPNLSKRFKFPECLKSLCYSSWNPPPNYRKMRGDLLYLEIVTLEGQECFITATPSGFFLNKTTSRENFDPCPRKTSNFHKHLVALLCQVSPLFKKNFTLLQKFGESMHAFEIQPVPYQVVPWVSPPPEHKPSNFRVSDTVSLQVVTDEFVVGQARDWNEEMQSVRELPSDTATARVFRDRVIFKTHVDFTQACTRGAVAIVDGCLPSLNPGTEFKHRLFIWNSIFFSFAFDSTDQFTELGGDDAAHTAAAANLHGVATFEQMETKDLYTSGTVIVDYRGYRVVCQSIVPGLLQREHDCSIVYGSLDGGKTISVDSRFSELLAKPAEDLHIRKHSLRTEKGEVVTLPSSVEVKGIVGTDSRHYAMDLCRIFPPDANYVDLPPEAKWRHKMAVLRPECLDAFFNYKIMAFLRLVREKVELVKKDAGSSTSSSLGESEETTADTQRAEGESSNDAMSHTTSHQALKDLPSGDKNAEPHGSLASPDEITSKTSSKKSLTSPPDAEPTSGSSAENTASRTTPTSGSKPKLPLHKSHPVCLSMMSSGGTALSALASTSDPLLEEELVKRRKVEPVADQLQLLDTLSLSEEKKVGPDIPQGIGSADLKSAEQQKLEVSEAVASQPFGTSAFKKALEDAGSLSQEEFLIQFNVDVLTPDLQHADTEDMLEKDRKLVKEAGSFLVESVLFKFLHDCIQLVVMPMDGEGLTQAMHTRGINVRYLGCIAQMSAVRNDLQHILRLCLSEMTTRLAKRKLRSLLQSCPTESTSECVCHFLNCLFCAVKGDSKEDSLANGQKKKSKKKKAPKVHKSSHLRLSFGSLWAEIADEMKWYYKCNLEYANLSAMCSKNSINKMSLLRSLCRKTGVQVLARNYVFSASPVFCVEDVVGIFPVVSHTDVRPVEATAVYDLAVSKYGLGQLHVARELFSNALQLFIQVYGSMHLDIANCYRHMARIEYMLSSPEKALASQHKATLVLERVLGVDHYETVSAYINLALYCHATGQSLQALRLLYRARYLILVLFGEGHPELATCDTNIGIILHSFGNFHQSSVFFSSALQIQNIFSGEQSLEVALTHHLLGRVQSYLGDFRAALGHEKVAFSIYNKKYGGEHKKTKESSQCLNVLTEKAVSMQKAIHKAGKSSGKNKLCVELLGGSDKSKSKAQSKKKN